MTFKEKDFIEIEFTGKVKGGDIFDSNIKKDLEKSGIKGKTEPFIFCLGEGMFVKGVDKFLIDKQVGEYDIALKPEEAFGKRDPSLIEMLPIKVFIQHEINPIPGVMLNFDGRIAKILTVSGGRVMVDFNNPLSGRELEYRIKVLRKVENEKEKIEALNDFFFRQKLEFEVKDKKIILKAKKEINSLVELFKGKYKEILNLDLEVEEIKEKKDEISQPSIPKGTELKNEKEKKEDNKK